MKRLGGRLQTVGWEVTNGWVGGYKRLGGGYKRLGGRLQTVGWGLQTVGWEVTNCWVEGYKRLGGRLQTVEEMEIGSVYYWSNPGQIQYRLGKLNYKACVTHDTSYFFLFLVIDVHYQVKI